MKDVYQRQVYHMIDSHELRRRDSYLNKLIGFQDTEPVKVITGIRRCGTSSLLKLMVRAAPDSGAAASGIHADDCVHPRHCRAGRH